MPASKSDPTTLLVAVDGSKHTEKVVDTACDLGKKVPAKLLLLFVSSYKRLEKEYEKYAGVETVSRSGIYGTGESRQIATNPGAMKIDQYYRAVGDAILSKLQEKAKSAGLECETLFEIGNPAAKIVEIAKERNAAMIVVGLHGLHGLARLRTLGSVSRRVVENSSCPVVVVP
jgi:nucleotide-binding universal stress UspA family protein